MLCEYALTPQILDDEVNTAPAVWLEDLYELGRYLMPAVTSANPIVVAGLCGLDGWRSVAKQNVEAINDHKVRIMAGRLLGAVSALLVSRELCATWPADEVEWIHEACHAHSIEPLHRILGTRSGVADAIASSDDDDPANRTVATLERGVLCSLEDVRDPATWDEVGGTWDAPRDIDTQIAKLRPMLIHSRWV